MSTKVLRQDIPCTSKEQEGHCEKRGRQGLDHAGLCKHWEEFKFFVHEIESQ